jgi:anti-sigma B factor antagonist
MSLKKKRSSNKKTGLCQWVVDEDLTIYVIDELKQGLSKDIDNYEHFELDLSKIEDIDSAGVQLLLALNTQLVSKKKTLKLMALSDSVIYFLNLYGVNDRFSQEQTV